MSGRRQAVNTSSIFPSVAMSSGDWKVVGWSGQKGIGCSFQEYQEVKGRKEGNSHVNTRNCNGRHY